MVLNLYETNESATEINPNELISLGNSEQYKYKDEFIYDPEKHPFTVEILKTLRKSPIEIGFVESDGKYAVIVGNSTNVDFGDVERSQKSKVQAHNHPTGEGTPSNGDFSQLDKTNHSAISMIFHEKGVLIYTRPESGWAYEMFNSYLLANGYDYLGGGKTTKSLSEMTPEERTKFSLDFGWRNNIIMDDIQWEDEVGMETVLAILNLDMSKTHDFFLEVEKRLYGEYDPNDLSETPPDPPSNWKFIE